MTDHPTTDPTDTTGEAPAPVPLAEQTNRNIKAEITRAGFKFNDVEAGIGMSHAASARRSSGELEWKLSEVDRVAAWLNISPDTLTSISR